MAREGKQETRAYNIAEGGEAIKSFNGFELKYSGLADVPEVADEKKYREFLNGAISNICDNSLRNVNDAFKGGKLIQDIAQERPKWVASLRKEATEFLDPEYSIYECTKSTAIVIGGIKASIQLLLERNRLDPKISATVWELMSKHKNLARRWTYAHYILTTISIVGSVIGTISLASSTDINKHRLFFSILMAFPAIAFALEKGFRVADNAQWNQNAEIEFVALRDKLYADQTPVAQAVDMLNELRRKLTRSRPAIVPITPHT